MHQLTEIKLYSGSNIVSIISDCDSIFQQQTENSTSLSMNAGMEAQCPREDNKQKTEKRSCHKFAKRFFCF